MIDMDIDYHEALSLMRRKDKYCCLRALPNEEPSTQYDVTRYEIVVTDYEDMIKGTLKETPSAVIPVAVFAATALKEVCEQIDNNVWILLPHTEMAYKTQVLMQR